MGNHKTKSFSVSDDFNDLQKRAHADLAARARGGIAIYLAVWLVSAFWVGVYQSNPVFFWTNTVLLVVIALMRVAHAWLLNSHPAFNTKKMYDWLLAMILLNALHWGVLTAWVTFSGQYPDLYYPYLIVLGAFGVGGTAVLSISHAVSIFYPLLIVIPTFMVGLWVGNDENVVVSVFAIFALLYVWKASGLSRKDYWSAISNQRMAEDRAKLMKKLSVTDQLTQLNNRMYFENKCIEEWERCGRLGVPLAIFMVDLDHFKIINDKHGHVAGDECLVKVGSVLKTELKRTIDTVARYGGEEFVIMITVTDAAALPLLAERIVRAVANIKMSWDGEPIPISCSVGLASTIPNLGANKDELLIAADKALYQAKGSGRNRYCIYGEPPEGVNAGATNAKQRKTNDLSVISDLGMTFN